ncbi:MAG: hypothetical protein EAX87_14890, partial [Candidatus Thorarchaeota archaeon]|nr:hypothetical protein [Candidatus Thorarchaeota archaeon]
MQRSIMKRETSCILALVLACLMVSTQFIGLLDTTYMVAPEDVEPLMPVEERAIASLDDMPLRM